MDIINDAYRLESLKRYGYSIRFDGDVWHVTKDGETTTSAFNRFADALDAAETLVAEMLRQRLGDA